MLARTRQAYFFAAVAATLGIVFAGTALAQSNNEVGVWKLNVAKSKYNPGPAPTSATTKIEAAGAGVKTTVDQALPTGTIHWEYTANYDGKDVRVTGNNPDADMIARTRVNATTVKSVNMKGGKATTTNTSVVSSDGKTRTVTTTGMNAAGKAVNNVAIYDKQ